jgi:hypothetical protein
MSSASFDRLIFLDFDGVLHPTGGAPGEELPFCWVPLLTEDLAPHRDVGLVIHSSWAERFADDDMREFIDPLDWRLVDVVRGPTKSQSILSYLHGKPGVCSWLVVEDEPAQFGDEFTGSLLVCDPRTGLSDPQVRTQLRAWLERGGQQTAE